MVSRDTDAAFRMRMFNPDGSEDMCGNGLRCVSLWAHEAGWLGSETQFQVATKEGIRQVTLREVSTDGRSGSFGAEMGVPQMAPGKLPFCGPSEARVVQYPLTVGGEDIFHHGGQHGQHAHGHFWAAAGRRDVSARVAAH